MTAEVNPNLVKLNVKEMQHLSCPARFKFLVIDKETKEVFVPYLSEVHFLAAAYDGAKYVSWKEGESEQVIMVESQWYITFLKEECEEVRMASRFERISQKVKDKDFLNEIVEEVKAESEV